MLLSSNNQKFYLSIFFLFFVLLVGFYYSFSFINFFFSFLIITFSFFVAYSKSIVSSVLSLIGLASVFSLVLFGYGATFLAVLYLAVYIGAVAVFFLFVVMMTDLSDESLTSNFSVKRPTFLSIFFCFLLASFFVFIFYVGFNFSDSFKSLLVWNFTFVGELSSINFFLNFDSNIESVARFLFREHVASFLILSVVILIALVGAILLTSSINLVDKHELSVSSLEPLDSIWENLKFSSFGDGKPQDMEIQLARNTSSSVNLNQAKYN